MRVWSLSPFLWEVDILEIRLAELDPVVDVFCLVEATQTHSAKPRELVFPQHEQRFSRWREKIRYLPIDFPDTIRRAWGRENYQREALGGCLKGICQDDIVIVSDVDEIPRAETVQAICSGVIPHPVHLSFPIHPYRLNWRWEIVNEGDCRCTVIPASQLVDRGDGFYQGVQAAINPSFCVFTGDCDGTHSHLTGPHGWHFTYVGDAEQIVAKAEAIADGWTKGQAKTQAAQRAIESGSDLYGRERRSIKVPITELPWHVQAHEERFAHLLTP